MTQVRPEVPGLERSSASVPIDDGGWAAPDGDLFGAERAWSPFGVTFSGHTIAVDPTTGGLTVAITDLALPNHDLPLRLTRTLDVQESHTQVAFLEAYPNTDPRPHFFGNWQLQHEAPVSAAWPASYPEVSGAGGEGGAALFYRADPAFGINTTSAAAVENTLRAYGVPGRTLQRVGWQHSRSDFLLRTRQGRFALATGHAAFETLVDPLELRLWRFDAPTGLAYRYTSAYAYTQHVDADDLREVTVPAITTQIVDALGHALSFAPVAAAPPYRSYVMADDAGRGFRLDLTSFISYRDGQRPGSFAKQYLVTRAVNQTKQNPNAVAYEYDQGFLTAAVYPPQQGGLPRRYTYEYDEGRHLRAIVDPVGDALRFEYTEDFLDSDDRLAPRLKVARIRDGQGNTLTYRYDHPRQTVVVTMADAGGASRSLTYAYFEDEGDTGTRYLRSETVAVAAGFSGNQNVTTRWTYTTDGHFNLERVTDAMGNVQRMQYDDRNLLTAVIDPMGHQRDLRYDVQAAPTAAQPHRYDLVTIHEDNVDAAGNVFPVDRTFTCERYGATTSPDAADAAQSTHRLASQLDELGNSWRYEYDDAANHFSRGPTRIVDPPGKIVRSTYDDRGLLLTQTDATANRWSRAYNTQGQLESWDDPNGDRRSWVYDPGTDWLQAATDALGAAPGDPAHSVRYTSNDAGQRLQEVDAAGAVTDYAYYASKRLRAMRRYEPAARETVFTYTPSGNVSSFTDPAGNQLLFRYDEAARLYEIASGNPAIPSIQFTMDAAGRVTRMRDRNGQTTQYVFDALGRMTSLQEPTWPTGGGAAPGKTVVTAYDRLGNRLTVTDSELPGPDRYRYDAAGNLVQRDDAFGHLLTYTYNARNELTRLADATGVIDLGFGRDDAGRLATLSDAAFSDPSRTFTYLRTDGARKDNLYRIIADASGIETRFAYDPNRQVTEVWHQVAGQPLTTYGYTYRADGLIGARTGDHVGAYAYDGLKQLVSESDAGVTAGYDPGGNRLWRAAAAPAPGAEDRYDDQNQLTSSPGAGLTFTYDANGNLTDRAQAGGAHVRYTYDGADRLREVDDGTVRVRYLYDHNSRLLERTRTRGGKTRTQRFWYANRVLLARLDAANAPEVVYTCDDEGRLLRRRGAPVKPAPSADPRSLLYMSDGLGSVCHLVDWDGAEHMRVDYDAWGGSAASGRLASDDEFRYRQAYEDPDSRLLKFGRRWYDPALGRWLSRDPLPQFLAMAKTDLAPRHADVLNLYVYARNSPISVMDLEGLVGVLPKGWPPPPGWKGGYKWTNGPGDRVTGPDGRRWHWHGKDDGHWDHWDMEEKGQDKRRLDKDGKDLGDDALKDPEGEGAPEKESDGAKTAKRVGFWALVGVGAWEVAKWGTAVFFAPETLGGSLAGAAALP